MLRDSVIAAIAIFTLGGCHRPAVCAHRSSDRTCLITRVVGDTPNGELGFRFDEPRDLDGDGIPDLAVGGRYSGDGYAGVWSRGVLVHRFAGEFHTGLFGQDVIIGAGPNGTSTIVVSAPNSQLEGAFRGIVDAYTLEGKRVWRAVGETAGLGWQLARTADIDGDGVDDVWAGAPSNPVTGKAVLLSGADGHAIRTIASTRHEDAFGWYLVAIGDVDGDGKPDVAIGAPGAAHGGVVTIASSATGAVLREITSDRPGERFGEILAPLDDVDGDGVADLAIGVPGNPTGIAGDGEVWIVSVKTGKVLHHIKAQQKGELFGRGLALVDDLDGDGLRDLAIGAPWYAAGTTMRAGRVEVRSSKTLHVLADLRGTTADAWFGWHIARATADGHKGMLVSAIRSDAGAGALELHAFE